jgi:hypothetical protein
MRKNQPRPTGRVTLHGEGAGALSWQDAETRAKEIARINGRTRVTENDREQARDELRSQNLPPTTGEDAVAKRSVSRDPSDPPARRGRRTRTDSGADPQTDLERIVVEGVEEAQHDQMRAASRRRRPPGE